MTSPTIAIDPERYESLRRHCDRNGIRFADFVADALENALEEEEILQKAEKVERLIQQMDRLRLTSFRRGFRQGFAAGVLAGQGRVGLSRTLTPAEVTHKNEAFKIVTGGQLSLFE
ncbi:hypothetical protein DSCA_48560 [Desulfosarcina alkanivorans]|uniref:Uncharacterized protein n=1 Tax=Desulfosarcina alkanivorans TaxID=571177 RepID=A0A5K7YNZ1_9BACT|nr:hypothetical protein [Desulfosarcina alkanivorans]BBO70926.1 hypothetical protein DSCA_48560 [Desulfosarcina alkanivorans]